MEEKDIVEYTLLKATSIDWDKDSMKAVIPKEHGNLNYVYRVTDDKGHSIYIKQAGTETRISKDMKPSRDRNRLESEILMLQEKFASGMVNLFVTFQTKHPLCLRLVFMRGRVLRVNKQNNYFVWRVLWHTPPATLRQSSPHPGARLSPSPRWHPSSSAS